jgi:phosphoribosylglycinamide formyltransferase 1
VLATEHRSYPLAVRWFVEGQLRIEQGVVRHTAGASQLLACLQAEGGTG